MCLPLVHMFYWSIRWNNIGTSMISMMNSSSYLLMCLYLPLWLLLPESPEFFPRRIQCRNSFLTLFRNLISFGIWSLPDNTGLYFISFYNHLIFKAINQSLSKWLLARLIEQNIGHLVLYRNYRPLYSCSFNS